MNGNFRGNNDHNQNTQRTFLGRHPSTTCSEIDLFRDRVALLHRVVVVEGHIAIDNLSELCLDVRIQLVVLDAVWGGKFPEAQKSDSTRARGSAAHLSRAMVVPSSLSQSSSMPSSV